MYDIIYGLWKTDILKKLRIREIFAPDRFLLLQASLVGKFKSRVPPFHKRHKIIKDTKKFGVNLSLQQKIYISFQTIFSIFERFIKIQYFSLKGKINLQFLVQENLERIKEAKKKIEKMGNKIS
jgi:translation initiation factor 2B subunit (eIF-2B alpha/beta/delta family)